MVTIILILTALLLFPSCSPESGMNNEIYLISVAEDFTGYGESGTSSVLKTVNNDQAAIVMQMSTFRNSDSVHIYAFAAQNGNRYFSTHPSYTPVDYYPHELNDETEKGNEVEASSSSFKCFLFNAESAEKTGWTMTDVLETVGSLNPNENDIVIFTYSGHGDVNGALQTNPDGENYDSTNVADIKEKFSSIPGRKVFIIDSCYSGQFISQNILESTETFKGSKVKDTYTGEDKISAIKNSTLTKKNDDYPSLWIMTAAGKGQEASDSLHAGEPFQSYYGAFSYYFLSAIGYDMDNNTSKKRSGELTFYSIYSYIRSAFPSYEISIQTPRASLKRLDLRIR